MLTGTSRVSKGLKRKLPLKKLNWQLSRRGLKDFCKARSTMASYDDHWVDRDPRPHTYPCQHCARDVETGGKAKCICVPSQPRKNKVTIVVPTVGRKHTITRK